MLPNLCQIASETREKKKKKAEFPLFSISPPFFPPPLFCSPFVVFHYCCWLWLCLAWLLQMIVFYSPLFLLCFLFSFMLLSVFLFGYAPYCVPTDSKKNNNLPHFCSSFKLCCIVWIDEVPCALCHCSPSFLFLTSVSFNPFWFNFGSHFCWTFLEFLFFLLFKNFSQMFVPESTCFYFEVWMSIVVPERIKTSISSLTSVYIGFAFGL